MKYSQYSTHQSHSRRSSNFFYTRITSSLPFIEIDLNLNARQRSLFINGLKYSIPCQSQHNVRISVDRFLTEQYQTMINAVQKCFKDHHIFVQDPFTKETFRELQTKINALKSQPLSKRLQRRARYEHRIIHSIQRLLRQRTDITICHADKTKSFYIGSTKLMRIKAENYMIRTDAYEKLNDNRSPLANHFHTVNVLLNHIVQQKGLTEQQAKKLRPNLNKLELAHYHGLPKIHKVKRK